MSHDEKVVQESIPAGDAEDSPPESPKTQAEFFARAAEKVHSKFPGGPGVYLFQDRAGRVLYVGKAKDLRARVSSYFLAAAAEDQRTSHLVREVYDVDFVEAESEVDALLMEARLVKDIQPKYNRELRDDKSFPYLQITTHEDYPRVEVTREPRTSGAKLYGPFANAGSLRGAVQALQKVFKFRTCSLDIESDDERWRWFRPCLLASINQCTAPCNFRIGKEEYRNDIKRLRMFLEGNRKRLLDEMRQEMADASAALKFEHAARLRDEIEMLVAVARTRRLGKARATRGVFHRPQKGLSWVAEDLQARNAAAEYRRRSISPTWAAMKRWPASCNSWMVCRSNLATDAFAFATSKASTTTQASAKSWLGGSASYAMTATCSLIFCLSTAASGNCERDSKRSGRSTSNRHWCSRWRKKRNWYM